MVAGQDEGDFGQITDMWEVRYMHRPPASDLTERAEVHTSLQHVAHAYLWHSIFLYLG